MTQTFDTINSRQIVEDIIAQLANSNRNLVSDEFEEGLDYLRKYLDLKVLRYKTGTPCWTWNVPSKWRIKDGYIKQGGREIVSFKKHPLHVMSYSVPVEGNIKGEELLKHVFVHNHIAEAIPYEFSFYKPRWGFCLTHAQKKEIKASETYEVRIDSELVDDHLSIGEYTVRGTSDEHIFFLCHIDHPFQVNDGLIGAAVHVALAKRLENERPYYNYTFLFGPETIGSIAYLSHHEALIPKIRYVVFVEMVGLENPLILQKSYKEQALINQYALYAMKKRQGESRGYPFLSVAGNDEKIFDSPGVGIPAISITRIDQEKRLRENQESQARGEYKSAPPYLQYHSHLDNVDLVNYQKVGETVDCLYDLVKVLEEDFIPVRKFKGPIFLSKYDLWIDWRTDLEMSEKMLWLMYLLEGKLTAFQVAQELNMDFQKVLDILNRLHEEGLIEKRNIHAGFDR